MIYWHVMYTFKKFIDNINDYVKLLRIALIDGKNITIMATIFKFTPVFPVV